MSLLHVPEIFSSSPSLDLPEFVESRTVLSESITFETMPTACSDDIPPFPTGHSPPLTTVIGLWNRLSLFPLSSRGKQPKIEPRPYITTPTSPRLKTMLDERICVQRWAQNVLNVAAPGHIPWNQTEDVPHRLWVPEGSSYPPETFRDALRSKRRRWHRNSCNAIRTLMKPESTCNQTSAKDNLIFEREITLGADGQQRRLSLQIPATSMSPEMVDLMLELKNLSSFFSSDPQDSINPVYSPEKEKNTLIPPTLMLSNSEVSVPILLDTVGDSPLPLATRRGKKVPMPLKLNSEVATDAYPDIPTAFLGSPSNYSPKFEFAATSSRQSMDFQDMIASLRNQCVILEQSYTCDDQPASPKPDASPVQEKPLPDPEDEDDWAFAAKLMETYGDQLGHDPVLWLETERPSCCPRVLPPESVPHNSSSEMGSDSIADISDESPDTSLDSIEVCSNKEASPIHISRPATPLPLRPALTNPSSARAAPGFLKRCKSVRFASLPSRHEPPPPMGSSGSPVPSAPRRSLGTPATFGSPHKPSPLRQSLTIANDTSRPRATSTRLVSPPPRGSSVRSMVKGRKAVQIEPASCGSPLISTANTYAGRQSGTDTFPFRRPAQKSSVAPGKSADSSLSPTTSPGRRSLGRFMSTGGKKGKENKSGPSSSQTKSGWSTLDENILRRESGVAGPKTQAKSRMPVPLRNIFKFK